MKGSVMPAIATVIDSVPTRIKSFGEVSRPTVNSRKMAPTSAMELTASLGWMNHVK